MSNPNKNAENYFDTGREDSSSGISDTPESRVDPGMRAVVGSLRYLFIGLRFLIVLLLFLFFFGAFLGFENFGGFFYVDEHEKAMLFRFGRLVPVTVDGEKKEVFGSGNLFWRWPYPIDKVKKINTQRPVVIKTRHFWPRQDPNRIDSSDSGVEEGLRPGYDGYLLTGDTNIMHMTWSVTYEIVDPKAYYLRFNASRIGKAKPDELVDRRLIGPEVMIRNLLEEEILHETAQWTGEEVWLRRRLLRGNERQNEISLDEQAQGRVEEPQDGSTELSRLLPKAKNGATESYSQSLVEAVRRRMLKAVREAGMGIKIQDINLVDVQPPTPCQASFNKVNEAAQEYQQKLDAAETYKTRELAEARGKAARLVADSESYQSRIVARAKAEGEVFEKIYEQYQLSPTSALLDIYFDTLRNVLPEVSEQYIMPAADELSQEVRLLLGRSPESGQEDD